MNGCDMAKNILDVALEVVFRASEFILMHVVNDVRMRMTGWNEFFSFGQFIERQSIIVFWGTKGFRNGEPNPSFGDRRVCQNSLNLLALLGLSGPFTGFPVTSYIKLINPRNQKVYFKIKTTAPKRYCVRPNSGILKAKEVTKIAVCLQPYEFVASEKNKHKFMVQTVVAPEGDDDDFVNDVWKDVDPSQIMDYKLKCVFENPVSNSADEDAATTANSAGADSNVTDGKNKSSGDTAKSSAQPMDELEEELHSAEQEIIQLRVSESSLRQECLQLKEEVLKYRSTMEKGANVTAGRLTSGHLERNTPPLPLTSTTVIISVVMVIVGYLLGKLI